MGQAAMEQMRGLLATYLREQAAAGTLAITEEMIAATVTRAVTLFLDGYAVEAPQRL